jgi:hypothetical protein
LLRDLEPQPTGYSSKGETSFTPFTFVHRRKKLDWRLITNLDLDRVEVEVSTKEGFFSRTCLVT